MARIAIYDSGVGGLSIAREVAQALPNVSQIFVSDNAAFPYGTKPADELIPRVSEITARICAQYRPDLIVIACNTASTVTLPSLRSQFDLPIVGVVPAIKPAAQLSHSGCIGLLATPATIARAYTSKLIDDFAAECSVVKVGSSALVQQAENKLAGKAPDAAVIATELKPFERAIEMDVLVLACTHFPLLNNEIEFFFKLKNHSIMLLDSGPAIARRVATLLGIEASANRTVVPAPIAAFTAIGQVSAGLNAALHQEGFNRIEALN